MPKTTPKVEKLPEFEKIGEQVMAELNRRLTNRASAAELPGTLLMRLAEQYLKYLEKKQADELAKWEAEEQSTSPLDLLTKEGLGLDRRHEILTQYLDDLEAEWRKASEMMVAMQEEIVKLEEEHEAAQMP